MIRFPAFFSMITPKDRSGSAQAHAYAPRLPEFSLRSALLSTEGAIFFKLRNLTLVHVRALSVLDGLLEFCDLFCR